MSNSEHTPGPWAAVIDIIGSPCVLTHRDDESAADWIPGNSGACIVTGVGDHTEQRTRGNEWANAVLIAASPDLLAIAKRLTQWDIDYPVNCYDGYAGLKALNEIIADAKAVIAKATQPFNPA